MLSRPCQPQIMIWGQTGPRKHATQRRRLVFIVLFTRGGIMKHISLIAAGLSLALSGAAPAPEEKETMLPGHKIPCDVKLLELGGVWKIVKGEYDADKRQVRWLLEAQKDVGETEIQLQE